ncbi:thymidylate kinase [Nasonia vitripennis]|uniref:Thymidylate kinase n=1 Tax=Nasonia vitripennis TaxID=7425 RepID=A0A7M7QVV5_NASVI|nr:thymidylate kinase [Nasonia vitripennis]XP_032453592.1 thymidylate kinase [Nasonia vitripennis]
MDWPREVGVRPKFAVSSTQSNRAASSLLSKRLISVSIIRTMARGAFIVLEGLDRAGKSTQVSMIVEALKERNVPVERRVFPDRSTAIGGIINDYLAKKIELAPEAVHLLFSANRWECKDGILETLEKGTTLIVDRYAASGAAYSAATTGRPLSWCTSPDQGLPAPDLVLYLDVTPDTQQQRSNWGEERFERAETQRKVAENFRKLSESGNWAFVEAGLDKLEVHQKLLQKVLDLLEGCKDKPIGKLYED